MRDGGVERNAWKSVHDELARDRILNCYRNPGGVLVDARVSGNTNTDACGRRPNQRGVGSRAKETLVGRPGTRWSGYWVELERGGVVTGRVAYFLRRVRSGRQRSFVRAVCGGVWGGLCAVEAI